ncbi:MAG: PilN domain-containing protein [Candidatus Omnitrophica bacterium]|nr:PilN domain-containing protein [Candidatus Omnitrophota bacterium]MDD5238693.1 PilN domain-containing protein [Candidatus Omnitrophota bacterium]
MIEINLLPEEVKSKAKAKKAGLGIKTKYFLYLLPAVLIILICMHLYLAIINIFNSIQLGSLNKQWQQLEPQRKALEASTKEQTTLSQDVQELQQLTKNRINWSQKLNKLSLLLPSGVWFNEISVSGRDFTLQGSVVSLQKEEVNLIKKLIDNLRNDADFFRDFAGLELGSVQKKTTGSYDVADFILSGKLKSND